MDLRFYDLVSGMNRKSFESVKLHNRWLQYRGVKVFLRSRGAKYDSSVYIVEKLSKKTISFDLKQGIWGGNNSGFGAMMLAVCLGCRRIGLLGVDMKVDTQKRKIHWHEGYKNQDVESFSKKLKSFANCFEDLASDISKNGVDIINLNPSSMLKCFSKDSIENFLRNT